MKRYYIFLFYLSASLIVGYAQQPDTLKHDSVSLRQNPEEQKWNKEMLEAIKKGTLIGPEPERKQSRRFPEKDLLENLSTKDLNNEEWMQSLKNPDSIQALQISDKRRKEFAAISKMYHRKTTVNDPQTIANPHITVSFDEILCYLFRPDLRTKMKNKKRAKAYKNY